jgi:hypothetical protein
MAANIYKSAKAGSSPVEGFSVDKVRQVLKARVIAAPVETGQQSFDNKVLDPFDIVVEGCVVIDDEGKWKKTIQTLRQMYANRKFEFYSASDGVNYYDNLILVELPIERDVSRYDIVSIEAKFVQAMLVQAKEQSSSSNSEDSSTRNLGYCAGKVVA